jgi:hypothetical protein
MQIGWIEMRELAQAPPIWDCHGLAVPVDQPRSAKSLNGTVHVYARQPNCLAEDHLGHRQAVTVASGQAYYLESHKQLTKQVRYVSRRGQPPHRQAPTIRRRLDKSSQPEQSRQSRMPIAESQKGLMRNYGHSAVRHCRYGVVDSLQRQAWEINEVAHDMQGRDLTMTTCYNLIPASVAFKNEAARTRSSAMSNYVLMSQNVFNIADTALERPLLLSERWSRDSMYRKSGSKIILSEISAFELFLLPDEATGPPRADANTSYGLHAHCERNASAKTG